MSSPIDASDSGRVLDRLLPEWHFHERHGITIHAPLAVVDRAVRDVTLAEMPLAGALFWLRALPARLLDRVYQAAGEARASRDGSDTRGSGPFLELMLGGGFVMLEDRPEVEVVVGTIGQFWRASGGSYRVPDAEAFRAFDRPEYAKAALDFQMRRIGRTDTGDTGDTGNTGDAAGAVPERVRLTTETRVYIVDPDARRRFARYWRVVYYGSALIRLLWLRAIKRRAERAVWSR